MNFKFVSNSQNKNNINIISNLKKGPKLKLDFFSDNIEAELAKKHICF